MSKVPTGRSGKTQRRKTKPKTTKGKKTKRAEAQVTKPPKKTGSGRFLGFKQPVDHSPETWSVGPLILPSATSATKKSWVQREIESAPAATADPNPDSDESSQD